MKTRRSISIALIAMSLLVATGAAQTKEVFGYSVEQRPLLAYVFGEGANVTMIFGAFHDNEPASPVVVESLRLYLAAHPEEWKGRKIILVPITNPDGQRQRSRTNAHGVDLNRNFPGTWQVTAAVARYNSGPSPASEPETQAVMHLVEKYSPNKIISIHQPFHCLNWNGEAGQILAQAMSVHNHYPTTGDIGYPTPGSFGNYVEGKGIGMVTLELPNIDAATCWRQNRDALLTAIRFEVPGSGLDPLILADASK
jgi:murein peptide amidase A